jgi:hypothetical protein
MLALIGVVMPALIAALMAAITFFLPEAARKTWVGGNQPGRNCREMVQHMNMNGTCSNMHCPGGAGQPEHRRHKRNQRGGEVI